MSKDKTIKKPERHAGPTRRQFLGAAGAVAGAAALGVSTDAKAMKKRHPGRGGPVRFATRADSRGLDMHRNYYYYVSHPLAGTSMGLMDLNLKMEPVPGLAVGHEQSADNKVYTFKLRQGAEFHNGESVTAEAIKWNFERILDPKVGHPFVRSAIKDFEKIEVLDKYTVRAHLKNPSAILIPNVTYYPLQFMAPGSVDKADTLPVGCGPFKFKSWKKFDATVLERFENWYETDDQGNTLPYLDGMIGKPKKEDRVRLTALRTGEVDLIDNMAYADGADFRKNYGDKFNAWDVPQVGTGYLGFNWKNGPFSPKNPHGKILRQAVAHAINHEAVHQAIFNGLSQTAPAFYSKVSPWYMPEIKRPYEFDPDKAKFLIKKAGAQDEPIILTSRDAYAYMHQTGEIVHAMLRDVGFKANHEIHPYSVLKAKWRKGDFHLDSTANSYRPDPDAWYGRAVYSEAGSTKLRTGFKNEKADKLILEAQQTADKSKRHELYMAVEQIVNEELPMLYTHFIPLIFAGAKNLKGFAPAFAGPYSTQGAGLRTAYMA